MKLHKKLLIESRQRLIRRIVSRCETKQAKEEVAVEKVVVVV